MIQKWFNKVSSIHELVPRLYLETALFQCYSILDHEDCSAILNRLIAMCRGIGDPLASAYARMYIVKAGLNTSKPGSTYLQNAIRDLLQCSKWGCNGNGLDFLETAQPEENISNQFIAERVFTPPMNWLMQCFCNSASNEDFMLVSNMGHDVTGVFMYMFTRAMMKYYPSHHLISRSNLVCTYLHHSLQSGEHPHEALIEFAIILHKNPPPEEYRIKIINIVWHLISDFKPLQIYLKATAPWIQYLALYFGIQDLHKIFTDVLKRLTTFSATDTTAYDSSLLQLLKVSITHFPNTEQLFEISSFQGLLGVFQRECGVGVGRSSGVTEMKTLLEVLLHHHDRQFINPTVIRLVLSLFSCLHDGINALTTEDEKRQISILVNVFVRQVSFHTDLEQQLEFYVDARAAFSSLDSVLENLIQHVCRLQITTMQLLRGKHTSRTASFERACTAYCFITIPSLSSPISRLKLYLLCGSVAMVNNCMGQGDACIKSAVKEIREVSVLSNKITGNELSGKEIIMAISNLSSYLVALPDPPDASQPLYLFRGLCNGIKALNSVGTVLYCQLNLAVLRGVCAVSQSHLPYHFAEVDGNDVLYGRNDALKIEAEKMCTELLTELLSLIKKCNENMRLHLICDLLEIVFKYTDLNDDMKILIKGLIPLMNKSEIKLLYEKRLKQLAKES